MKKNTLFKIAAFTTALAIACGTSTGCSKKESSKTSNEVTQTAMESFAKSYKAIPLDKPSELSSSDIYIQQCQKIPNTDNILINYNDESASKTYLCIAPSDLSSIQPLDIDFNAPKNSYTYYYTSISEKGIIYILAGIQDYGDLEIPNYDDPDFDWENFDYEAFEEARQTSYKLITADTSGKTLSSIDLKNFDTISNDINDFYISNILAVGEDKILANIQLNDGSPDVIATIGTDGKIIASTSIDKLSLQWVNGIGLSSDEKIGISGYSDDGNGGYKILFINPDTLQPEEDKIELNNFYISDGTLYTGSGEYIFFANSDSGYCGIKADGTCDEIVNFVDADLEQDGNVIISIGNGEFLCVSSYTSDFYRLVKRDASETENVNIITIATLYNNWTINNMVKEFNQSHDKIRLKTVSYEDYYEYDEDTSKLLNSPEQQLRMDIIAGKAPDMVVVFNQSTITSLASKGVFTDLYKLMDSELSKDMILDNVLNANETNGKLLSLSPTFFVETFAAKEKYCDIENWTFSDLKKTYENLPEGMNLFQGTDKTSLFNTLVSASAGEFIDYTSASCNFDSPEFIEMLEFCNQLPSEAEAFDWENASSEEMEQYYNDMETACANDKALLKSEYLYEFRNYAKCEQVDFGGEKITFVGFPSSNGNGAKILFQDTFAILESSNNKEACWEFIKTAFSEKNYEDQSNFGFASLKSAFEKQADEAMNKPYYIDDDGKKQEYDYTDYVGDKEIKINPLTKEQRDFIVNYVKNAKSSLDFMSDDVNEIIQEEIATYYAGEKTVEETAKNIQSRVSILISEQY